MNKLRNTPKTINSDQKKTIANFVRKAVKLDAPKKTPLFESNLGKVTGWIKRQNDSWDY